MGARVKLVPIGGIAETYFHTVGGLANFLTRFGGALARKLSREVSFVMGSSFHWNNADLFKGWRTSV